MVGNGVRNPISNGNRRDVKIAAYWKGYCRMTEFKPQGTTMDTFHEIENRLFNAFTDAGYEPVVAKAVAHSFTQYMLGYLTEEGVARRIVDSGGEEDLARGLAHHFKTLRDDDGHSGATPNGAARHEREPECMSR